MPSPRTLSPPAPRRAERDINKHPLRIQPIAHESMCFMVESKQSDPADPNWADNPEHPPYRVELESGVIDRGNGHRIYNGTCTCPDYSFRKHKKVDQGVIARCDHIRAGIYGIYDVVMESFVSNRNRRARAAGMFATPERKH